MKEQRAQHPFEPRSILVCVAETNASDHAISVAADLANRFRSRLELLHAVPVAEMFATRFDTSEIAAINAERTAESRTAILEKLARSHGEFEVDGTPLPEFLHVVPGNPAKVVLDRAEEVDADLIVLGDSGKTKNLDFGGVARALLSRAECPLWMQITPPRPIERILAPVDLSDHSFAALQSAVDLALSVGAEVTALHCYTVNEFAYVGAPYTVGYSRLPSADNLREDTQKYFEEQLAEFDWKGVEHQVVFEERDPAAGILERQNECDLIAMGTHGRTGLAAALLGGVAYRVMRSAHTPVLAIRQPNRPWLL